MVSAAQAAGLLHVDQVELFEAAVDAFLGQGFGASGVSARELLILCNAAQPTSSKLGDRWRRLHEFLDHNIFHPLRRAVPGDKSESWSRMEDCISELDLDHLGVAFTAQFLAEVKAVSSTEVFVPSTSVSAWVKEAAAACAIERERAIRAGMAEAAPLEQQKLVRQLDKVNKREIVAWVRYATSTRREPGRAFSWQLEAETRREDCKQELASHLLRPLITRSRVAPNMVGEHDRSGHAERCALLQVAADLLQGSHSEEGASIEGQLFLYVTHYPCISCVCVIAQFSRLFPRLAIHLAYADGRAGHAQALESGKGFVAMSECKQVQP